MGSFRFHDRVLRRRAVQACLGFARWRGACSHPARKQLLVDGGMKVSEGVSNYGRLLLKLLHSDEGSCFSGALAERLFPLSESEFSENQWPVLVGGLFATVLRPRHR